MQQRRVRIGGKPNLKVDLNFGILGPQAINKTRRCVAQNKRSTGMRLKFAPPSKRRKKSTNVNREQHHLSRLFQLIDKATKLCAFCSETDYKDEEFSYYSRCCDNYMCQICKEKLQGKSCPLCLQKTELQLNMKESLSKTKNFLKDYLMVPRKTRSVAIRVPINEPVAPPRPNRHKRRPPTRKRARSPKRSVNRTPIDISRSAPSRSRSRSPDHEPRSSLLKGCAKYRKPYTWEQRELFRTWLINMKDEIGHKRRQPKVTRIGDDMFRIGPIGSMNPSRVTKKLICAFGSTRDCQRKLHEGGGYNYIIQVKNKQVADGILRMLETIGRSRRHRSQ